MATCKLQYKGELYSEQQLQSQVEIEYLEQQAQSFSLPDSIAVNKDTKIAEAFHLRELGAGEFIATINQLKALRKWTKVNSTKMHTRSYINNPGETIVSFFNPDEKQTLSQSASLSTQTKDQGENESDKKVESVLQKMQQIFPGINYKFIDPSELKQEEHIPDIGSIKAFVQNDIVYLVSGRTTTDVAIEEVLHPFVMSLSTENEPLFRELLREGKRVDPEFFKKLSMTYEGMTDYTPQDVNREFVTQMLQRALSDEQKEADDKQDNWSGFRKLVNKFLQELVKIMNKIIQHFDPSGRSVLDAHTLPANLSFSDLAKILNTQGTVFHLNYDNETKNYSLEDHPYGQNQPDQRFLRQGPVKQRDRVAEDIARVKKVLDDPKVRERPKQIESLKKLLKQSEELYTMYNNSIEDIKKGGTGTITVATSGFIGSTDFETTEDYSMFKNFGIFMHEVIDRIQKEANDKGIAKYKLFTKERFKEIYDEFQTTNDSYGKPQSFEIEGLTEEEMYNMLYEAFVMLSSEDNEGSVIIPEYTLGAKLNVDYLNTNSARPSNRMIIGRLDILVVDKEGTVKVVDFKTKKVKSLEKTTDPLETNENRVYVELATTSSVISGRDQTHVDFHTTHRSVYDTWTVQLMTYEYMLRQHDLTPHNSEIVAIAYQATPAPEKRYRRYAPIRFRGNFYSYADAIVDSKGRVRSLSQVGADRYNTFKKTISSSIPVPESQKEKAEIEQEPYLFDMTPEAYNTFIKKLTSTINLDIDEIRSELQTVKNRDHTQMELDVLNMRLTTLEDYERIAQNGNAASSIKLRIILDQLQNETSTLYDSWKKIADERKNRTLVHQDGTEKTKEELHKEDTLYDSQMLLLYRSLKQIHPVQEILEQRITEAKGSDSRLEGSLADSIVNEMHTDIVTMTAMFREYGINRLAKMIMEEYPEEVRRNVSKDMKLALEPKIKALTTKIEQLRAGDIRAVVGAKMEKLISVFNPGEIDRIKEELGKQGNDVISEIEILEYKLQTLIQLRDTGYALSEEKIKQYIQAVGDPTSRMYIGQGSASALDVLGLNLDGFIATTGNSDLAMSAFANYLKSAQIHAQSYFQNDMQESGLQKDYDALLAGSPTKEAVNEKLTQVRTRTQLKDDGTADEIQEVSFIKPSAEGFDNVISEYRQRTNLLRRQIKQIKMEHAALGNGRTANDVAEFGENLRKLVKEKEQLDTEHIAWLRENATLPYTDDYYKYRQMLGPEYREKLEELYMQRESIVSSVGVGNEEKFSEEDYNALEEIDLKIRKLRSQAAKENPNYQEYIDLLESLYDHSIDTVWFDRVHERKKLEYANSPEKLAKWEFENLVDVPTDEYYQELERLYDRKEEIIGSSASFSELIKERNFILKTYRREDRTLDFRRLSDEDKEALEEINSKIEALKTESKGSSFRGLSQEERDELRDINERLNQLSQKVPNRIYIQEKKARYNNLLKRKNALKEAESRHMLVSAKGDPQQIEAALNELIAVQYQFERYEKEFKVWYEKFHKDEYRSIYSSGDKRGFVFGPLRSFVEDTIPVDKRWVETRPSSKWSKRTLKESAKNPNYKTLADQTVLPKGLQFNAEGHVELAPDWESYKQNIDPKFIELQNDPTALKFYNNITSIYFKRQEKITGVKNGYRVPAVKGSTIENFMGKSISQACNSEIEKMRDKLFTRSISEEDRVMNLYGDMGIDHIRLRGNQQYNADLQGTDSVGATFNWLFESYINEGMADAQPVSRNVLETMRLLLSETENSSKNNETDRKRLKEFRNAIDIMEFEQNKFISGKMEKPESRKVKKAIGMLFKMSSFARLGFDVTSQLKNYVSGNIQAYLAADPSSHYTAEDIAYAKLQLSKPGGFLHTYMRDWGKIADLSKETMLYRMFNPLQKDYWTWMHMKTDSKTRRMIEKGTNLNELAFAIQDKGDTEIGMTTWLAIMNANKFRVGKWENGVFVAELDEEGNEKVVNALDAYEATSEGKVQIRPDVEFTQKDADRLRRITYSEIRRAQGNFAKSDMTMHEQGIIFKSMLFFRKYLVPMVVNRLGTLRPNWEGEEAAYGYWRAMYSMWSIYGKKEFMKHLLLGGFAPKMIKSTEVNEFYQRKAAQASRDFVIGILLASLSYLMLSVARSMNDDDDDELSMMEGNIMRLLWGVTQEANSMTPMPFIGSFDEYIRSFSVMSTLTTDVTKMYNSMEHAAGMSLYWAYDSDGPENGFLNAIYTRSVYQRKVGPFEKGDPKFYKDLYDLTGYKNVEAFFKPEYRVSIMKKNV